MHEIYYEVLPILINLTTFDLTVFKSAIHAAFEWGQENAPEVKCLEREEAQVRFFFRHPEISDIMCRLAGKLLQKKEVCNRSGNYSSKINNKKRLKKLINTKKK